MASIKLEFIFRLLLVFCWQSLRVMRLSHQLRAQRLTITITMKTKTKTIVHFTTPSGLVFTDKAGFIETLFTPINGKTAFGYFTRHKSAKHGTRAIKLHRGNGEVFAVIVSNGRFASLKSLSMRDGKEWALAAATSADEKLLGFDGLSYVEEINLCVELVKSMNPEKGKVDA